MTDPTLQPCRCLHKGERCAVCKPGTRKTMRRCRYTWERRGRGMRYVYQRGRCHRITGHASGYCTHHKFMRRDA